MFLLIVDHFIVWAWRGKHALEGSRTCAQEEMGAAWPRLGGMGGVRARAVAGSSPCRVSFPTDLSCAAPPASCALQAFAEAQKRDLAAVRAELDDSQRSGREGQHRLRGLEEQLLAAQDACSKANSQVGGRGGAGAGGGVKVRGGLRCASTQLCSSVPCKRCTAPAARPPGGGSRQDHGRWAARGHPCGSTAPQAAACAKGGSLTALAGRAR